MMRSSSAGFSLIEVLVSVLIVALGVLGMAKMQALAIAGTKNSATRSLMAMQVASLASLMHANQGYWASSSNTGFQTTAMSGSTPPTIGTAPLAGLFTGSCSQPSFIATSSSYGQALTPASPTALAAYDAQCWINGLYAQFPGISLVNVSCSAPNTATTVPIPAQCTIKVQWVENQATTPLSPTSNSTGGVATATFTAYVEP